MYKAEWAGGEINIDPQEIGDAGWHSPGNMPETIPSEATIARWLVDDYLKNT
jgi:NADH pyrophosphatase NudC (nudix superfamily)